MAGVKGWHKNRLGTKRVRDVVLEVLEDARAEPRVISVEQIVDAIWGFDAEGGPLSADDQVRQAVVKLRREGYSIHRVNGYVLED